MKSHSNNTTPWMNVCLCEAQHAGLYMMLHLQTYDCIIQYVIKLSPYNLLPGLVNEIEYCLLINHESICQQRKSANAALCDIL